jgi:uncharacterized protein
MMAGQAPTTVFSQRITGLLIGIGFGILLYEGGLANYNVIEGQLLLTDFTFLEILLSAMIVATAGFFILSRAGLADRKTMQPSLGTHLAGGLMMGAGFALLGYGPASVLAAAGAGYPDALAGLLGILFGAGLFARTIYPVISRDVLGYRKLDSMTLPDLLGRGEPIVLVLVIVILLFMLGIISMRIV